MRREERSGPKHLAPLARRRVALRSLPECCQNNEGRCAMPEGRTLPRPFTMNWGSGQITEEAAHAGEWKESRIQLMEYTDGEAAGGWSIRFCYYSHDGRFQRGPLMMDEPDV